MTATLFLLSENFTRIGWGFFSPFLPSLLASNEISVSSSFSVKMVCTISWVVRDSSSDSPIKMALLLRKAHSWDSKMRCWALYPSSEGVCWVLADSVSHWLSSHLCLFGFSSVYIYTLMHQGLGVVEHGHYSPMVSGTVDRQLGMHGARRVQSLTAWVTG